MGIATRNLIVPGKGDHLYLAAEQGLVMMADGRAVDACALAGVHFDKAVLQRTGFDLLMAAMQFCTPSTAR